MSRLKSMGGIWCGAAMTGWQNRTVSKTSAAARSLARHFPPKEWICAVGGDISFAFILGGQRKGFKAYSLFSLGSGERNNLPSGEPGPEPKVTSLRYPESDRNQGIPYGAPKTGHYCKSHGCETKEKPGLARGRSCHRSAGTDRAN